MPPTLGHVRADHLTDASPTATYLDARKRPALWYQADPGDADRPRSCTIWGKLRDGRNRCASAGAATRLPSAAAIAAFSGYALI